MTHRWKPSSRKRRRGLTLIEVVAGLVVLAVLVSSLTLARGRLMRQWAAARTKLQATEAVDRLLASWVGGMTDGPDAIPLAASGPLQGVEGCTWRTTPRLDPAAGRLGATVVRLDVFHGPNRLFSVEVLKQTRARADGEQGGRS
jgi:prepilin-type N-terminal cleavage/methylation domain-containing protein